MNMVALCMVKTCTLAAATSAVHPASGVGVIQNPDALAVRPDHEIPLSRMEDEVIDVRRGKMGQSWPNRVPALVLTKKPCSVPANSTFGLSGCSAIEFTDPVTGGLLPEMSRSRRNW